MANPKITDDELQITCHWLMTAQRFLAFSHGHVEQCKKRSCNGAAMCLAQNLDQSPEKNMCGLPLRPDEIAQTVQLALFGMMLEEGLLNNAEDSAH